MKRSKKVTLVLITAALSSCNRSLAPASSSGVPTDSSAPQDSTYVGQIYDDPVYEPWYNSLLNQWIYAFNPYCYGYYYYGPVDHFRGGRIRQMHRISRSMRSTVIRGGWGRSAHTTVNS